MSAIIWHILALPIGMLAGAILAIICCCAHEALYPIRPPELKWLRETVEEIPNNGR